MTKASPALALVYLFSGLCPVASEAADPPGKIASVVDRAFRPLLAQYDVPGMAVAVTIDGRQCFFAYGVASKESRTAVTKDTLFEIGSLSKTFTATLFSYAQVLGKISLNDSPGKFMPALRGSAIDSTSLLNLGTYTAGGLPLQFPDAVTDDHKMAAYFQQWQPTAAPGVQRLYSNPSIGLFGYLTALAMKGDFIDLMESEVFARLGLDHTFIRVPQSEIKNYAWGYNRDNKPIRVNPGVFDAEAYGIKSTAANMIRFVEANIRPETLKPPIRGAIEGTHTAYFQSGEMLQGLGWEQYPYPISLERLLAGNSSSVIMEPNPSKPIVSPKIASKETLFNKTGSTGGFGAYAAFVPQKRIGVVMLANKNFPIPARVTASYAVLEQLESTVRP